MNERCRDGEQGVKTLMIAGGGTGGHIYPAIAIAREYISRDASRRAIFVGTEYGLEKTIVPKAGFPLEFIEVGGLKGKGGLDLLRNLARLPLGFVQAFRLIGRHEPSVVLGVGGYSSGPVLIAAVLRRVPSIIHEANAFPGLANRGVSRFVTSVAVAFAEALPRLGRTKDGVVTGNPIRQEFFDAQRQPTNVNRQRLLIFGGSQGSRVINNALLGALKFLEPLKDSIEIVHQTGAKELDKVQAAYRETAFATARVVPYLDPMVDEIAAADLVVCRAGAMTLGEIAAIGRAAILIPFADATNNHQEVNARVIEQAGGAMVITEKELSAERLAGAIADVLRDPSRATRMGKAAKTLAMPDATKKIVDLIDKIQRN
jgi:UDP-N-acetylglucosamine--N-acetylmuramyl-(pentapeptide) pyrophosphoryl-undecaprenol N-acetylglucosamine transferase